MDNILGNEATIRLFIFFLVLLGMMAWEWFSPKRDLSFSRFKRWPNNLLLVFVNAFLLRILFPVLAVGVADFAAQKNLGLFNIIHLPLALSIPLIIIFFDFVIYLQHVVFHLFPVFWRFHRMHHTDLDLDTTSGLRFHPIEIILSMLIKIFFVFLLGAPAIGVMLFEIILNAMAMFNHGNVSLPINVDKFLRRVIVTPDMHRVHHSVIPKETNSNYGFNLSWWDKLCRTYIAQPEAGHKDMTIGLNIFRKPKYLRLDLLLTIPFIRSK